MKKFSIALLALIISGTMVAVIASTTPSVNNPKATERKARREARQEQVISQMKAALATQRFTFYPTSYTLPYQNPVETYGTAGLYLDFYPENLDINLPFEINQGKEFNLDSQLVNYEDYNVKATKNPNVYIVTAELNNISNSGLDMSFENQNMNINIHISVNLTSGSAYMTLTPDFSAAVSYQGTIRE